MAVEHGRVDVEGVSLHYLTAGEGPPLVLLHGGIVDSASLSWGGVLPDLAASHEVYALDLPGYGESERPDAPYSTAYHVRMVAGFVDALDLAPACVAGVSLGSGVALGLALSTDAVERLALVDSYGLGRELPNGLLSYALARVPAVNRLSIALLRRSKRLTRASLAGVVHDPDAVPQDVVDELYDLVRQPGAGAAFRRWREHEVTRRGYRTTYVDRLEEVAAPTLLLHGAEDELFPVAWAERASRLIPDARLTVFENCAHWPPRERPDDLVVELASFLDGG